MSPGAVVPCDARELAPACEADGAVRFPQRGLLTRCLASALALGPGMPRAEHILPSRFGDGIDARISAAIPAQLSAAERELFIERVRSAERMPPAVPNGAIVVTRCDDSGPGSLRAAINDAVDGDTIDMRSLACSTITLTSGAIAVGQASLTVQGPGMLGLEISGNDTDRVFFHLGNGTLSVYDLTMSHGRKYRNDGDAGNASGGCIFSTGGVVLGNTWTRDCSAGSNDVDEPVRGGAIHAASVTLADSLVTGSSAISTAFEDARGGGVYAHDYLFLFESVVSGNTAMGGVSTGGGIQLGSLRESGVPGRTAGIKYSTISANASDWSGGGAYLSGETTVGRSTISTNQACRGGGLYLVRSDVPTGPAALYSSTVSGNTALCGTGAAGVGLLFKDAEFTDMTIAFNTTRNGVAQKYGSGVRIDTSNSLGLQNTIISNNTTDTDKGTEIDDIGGSPRATVTGANNLVGYPSSLVMPPGTILLTSAMLRPLAANGGPTATHVPNFGSPVVDAGNDAGYTIVDQRGPGFPRIIGPQADIGSTEFDLEDPVFADGFD